MLFICTWRWGTKWKPHYAERLYAGIKRNLSPKWAITVLITDQPETCDFDIVAPIDQIDRPLLALPGCLARMRMFDRAWQDRLGARPGDRIICIDVDAVIVGRLDPLFEGEFEFENEFTIMQGFNTTNPCPFNGSLWMFRAGERHDVWDDFSLDAYSIRNVPVHAIPDDQGWLHHKFPKAGAYGPENGVYAFKKRTWPGYLPENARVVAFPGRDPAAYVNKCEWVRQHWRC